LWQLLIIVILKPPLFTQFFVVFVKNIWLFQNISTVAEIQPIVFMKQPIVSTLSALVKSVF